MSRLVSLAVLLAFIIIIGALFYKVMIGFLVPVFLAAVLVVVFRPLHRWVTQRVGERDHFAAAITTATILFLVLLPAVIVGSAAAVQGASLLKNFNSNSISLVLSKLRKHPWVNLEMKHADSIHRIQISMEELQNKVAISDFNAIDSVQGESASLIKRLRTDFEALSKELAPDPETPDVINLQLIDFCQRGLSSLDPHDRDKFGHPFPRDGNEEEKVDKDHQPDILDLHQRAIELGNDWQALKEKLLGGPTRTLLVELANPGEEQLRTIGESALKYVQPRIVSLTSTTGAFVFRTVISMAILVLALYFFLYDGPAMIRSIMQLSPLDDRYEQELLLEFDRTARAVVLATILSAVLQGLIAGVGYWWVGMPSLTLLILLTCACALIPFVGPALIWVPVCLYLLVYRDDAISAAGLAIYGVLIVGTSDNFVKAFVLHGQRQLHPLLALLSVLGGVQALGPIGILVGPMAVTMLQTLLGILQHELLNFDGKLQSNFGVGFDGISGETESPLVVAAPASGAQTKNSEGNSNQGTGEPGTPPPVKPPQGNPSTPPTPASSTQGEGQKGDAPRPAS